MPQGGQQPAGSGGDTDAAQAHGGRGGAAPAAVPDPPSAGGCLSDVGKDAVDRFHTHATAKAGEAEGKPKWELSRGISYAMFSLHKMAELQTSQLYSQKLSPTWLMPPIQAECDAGVEELRIVREEAKRWEARVNELLLKYGSVDLQEYNRVADALKVGTSSEVAAKPCCDAAVPKMMCKTARHSCQSPT